MSNFPGSLWCTASNISSTLPYSNQTSHLCDRRGDKYLKMTESGKLKCYLVFAFWLLLPIIGMVAAESPQAVSDMFVLKDGKLQRQTFDAVLNSTWHSTVYEYKLDVLANDIVDENQQETCIVAQAAGSNQKTTKITFQEKAKAAGFTHSHRDHMAARPHCVFDFIVPFYNSTRFAKLPGEFCTTEHITGGAAVGDYDNDGLQDVFFSVFHKRSVLYKNMGNGKFRDVTSETAVGPAKYANGAVWVDIDQDGDLDLFVTSVGGTRHYLYVNYGGHFREEAKERGIALEFPSKRKLAGFTPSVGDFDQDGYPDVYVSEWILHSQSGGSSASRLMRNLGKTKPGFFEDVTDKAGVNVDNLWTKRTNLNGGTHTFGSSFTDFDNDGLQELLITGDYGESRMFWNNGNMTFTECTRACGLTGDVDAMGHAIGDWNNDGNLEWFSTAIFDNATNCEVTGCMFGNKGNKLFKNLGERKFNDVSDFVGVRDGGWGWGAAFFDFNNDGYLDIVMTNGLDTPSTTVDDPYMKQQMKLFKNYGPNAAPSQKDKMKEVASDYGMKYDGQGRGILKFDYDNDGDEDVVVAANVGPAVFYENVGGNNKDWLRIQVFHRCGTNDTKLCDSYGARVVVQDSTGRKQTQEIGSSTHFLGQSEMTAHFGLLHNTDNTTVSVTWPATKQTVVISNVTSRSTVRVVRPNSMGKRMTKFDFSSIQKCPSLEITEVNMKPGAMFGVVINPDKKSLQLKLHPAIPLIGLGKQSFSYKVKVSPERSNTTASATVTIDARVFLRNKTVTSMCPSGRMWIPGMPVAKPTTKRTWSGVSNNMKNLFWGAAKENLRRLVPSKYTDDISMPAAACSKHERLTKKCPYPHELSGHGSKRPPPRVISNELFAQKESVESERGLSDLFVHYGQFLSHDIDFSSPLPRFEFQGSLNEVWTQISVPKGDPHFDQDGTGGKYLPFIRSTYNRCTGMYPNGYQREQMNKISSYIDATDTYGNTQSRCQKLRSMVDGKLRLGDDGLIPKNDIGLDNDNPTGRKPSILRVAGDTRANVAPGLLAFHTIFVKEHNRLCDLYKKKHPTAGDEEIFQYAKRIVVAEHQAIAIREYLPALVGQSHIPKYKGYNSSIDASASNVFATAAFRFGHSQVNSHIFRFDEKWEVYKYGHLLLRESYFHPERVAQEGGIEPIIRGMTKMAAQKVDTLIIDELRNVLFPVGRGNGLDLAAMNLQRGRDHGLPDYNSVRKSLGLKGLTTFSEITANKEVASKLKSLYKDINNIDLWAGGLAEDHIQGSELGETFQKIFLEGMLRIRDGDRFWYEKIMSPEEIKMVNNLTLSNIIKLNTNVKDIPDNVFFSSKRCKAVIDHQCVPHQNKDPDSLLKTIRKLNTENQDAKQKYLSSLNQQMDQMDAYQSSTIALGVVCAVVFLLLVVAVVKILPKRGKPHSGASGKSAYLKKCAPNGNGHNGVHSTNGNAVHTNGKHHQNGDANSKI